MLRLFLWQSLVFHVLVPRIRLVADSHILGYAVQKYRTHQCADKDAMYFRSQYWPSMIRVIIHRRRVARHRPHEFIAFLQKHSIGKIKTVAGCH